MFALMIVFWVMFFIVSYIGLVFILLKGKQHNRYFATFLSTLFPVVGSVPAYIMASKYEKRISNKTKKVNNNTIKYILIGMQVASVLLMLAPFYKVDSQYVSLMSLIFGSSTYGGVLKPAIFLIYILILPIISAMLNFCLKTTNVSNFITYLVSFINIFSVLIYGFIVTSLEDISSTYFVWIYSIFNVLIMGTSLISLVVNRDAFLFKLEYSEKIEYIKEQKKKAEKKEKNEPDKSLYKCSKCGKMVEKGTLCSCVSKKSEALKVPKKSIDEKNEAFLPASFCIYCKKPLDVGQECECQGDGFGITIKNESKTSRKCIYCGQILVGESTCVCEKIMKNSVPGQDEKDSKKYFESQVEKGDSFIADELAQLEKTINSKFEHIKENMDFSINEEISKSEE